MDYLHSFHQHSECLHQTQSLYPCEYGYSHPPQYRMDAAGSSTKTRFPALVRIAATESPPIPLPIIIASSFSGTFSLLKLSWTGFLLHFTGGWWPFLELFMENGFLQFGMSIQRALRIAKRKVINKVMHSAIIAAIIPNMLGSP